MSTNIFFCFANELFTPVRDWNSHLQRVLCRSSAAPRPQNLTASRQTVCFHRLFFQCARFVFSGEETYDVHSRREGRAGLLLAKPTKSFSPFRPSACALFTRSGIYMLQTRELKSDFPNPRPESFTLARRACGTNCLEWGIFSFSWGSDSRSKTLRFFSGGL